MKQSEFNDFVADEIASLRAENKALKKQLGAIKPELLEEMKVTMDSAQAMHSVIKTERATMSEQNLQDRKLREEMDAEYKARHSNAMEAMRRQAMGVFDSNAQTQSMLDEIRAGHDDYARTRQSANEHQEWVENNYKLRREQLENFDGAKEFITQQVNAVQNSKLSRDATELLQQQMRLLVSDPTAFAQQMQNPPAEPNNLASDNSAE